MAQEFECDIDGHIESSMASLNTGIRQILSYGDDPSPMDVVASDEVLRQGNLSPLRSKRMNRIMLSLRKSIADLGDSSRSLTKSKKNKSHKKGNSEGVTKFTACNTEPFDPYAVKASTSIDTEMMQEDLCLPNPGNASNNKKEAPPVRPGLKTKSSSRRIFPFPPANKPDAPVTVHDRYLMKDQIGVGGFSKVFKATHRLSGRNFAIKRIQVSLLSGKDKQNIKSEVSILRSLNHASIISVYDIFQTDSEYVYLVMERVKGGELYNCIVDHGTFSEQNARVLCKSMLRAVKYCHDRGVVHRDLKPENILLVAKNSYEIKLCDFGCAGRLRQGEFLQTFCGTINYMSPEMVKRRQYGVSVDMWSLGVILYVAMAGYHPFEDNDHTQLKRLIEGGCYNFKSPEWSEISPSGKELISAMMEVDPNARISADMALLHPWSSSPRPSFVYTR